MLNITNLPKKKKKVNNRKSIYFQISILEALDKLSKKRNVPVNRIINMVLASFLYENELVDEIQTKDLRKKGYL